MWSLSPLVRIAAGDLFQHFSHSPKWGRIILGGRHVVCAIVPPGRDRLERPAIPASHYSTGTQQRGADFSFQRAALGRAQSRGIFSHFGHSFSHCFWQRRPVTASMESGTAVPPIFSSRRAGLHCFGRPAAIFHFRCQCKPAWYNLTVST